MSRASTRRGTSRSTGSSRRWSSSSPSATAPRSPPLPEKISFPAEGIGEGAISLRLKREADVGALVAACQDPEIPRYTEVPYPYGEEEARRWLEISEERRLAGTDLSLLVVDSEDRLLGSVGLHDVDRDQRRAEIGYWTAAEARRRGVATRAVRLLSGHAFGSLPLERIGIAVEAGNEGSRRVAEQVGFRPEGVLRAWMVLKGRSIDVLMHSLLREEAARLAEPRP